jgi:hypothetical protein
MRLHAPRPTATPLRPTNTPPLLDRLDEGRREEFAASADAQVPDPQAAETLVVLGTRLRALR